MIGLNKIILFYSLLLQVSYWLATSSESTAKQQITREQNVHLLDLAIYTDYAIVVQAFNLAGEGPKSDVVYQKTEEGCEYLNTVKRVLSGHLKIHKTNVLKTNGSLMKVKSIAECSFGAFCNTFDLH